MPFADTNRRLLRAIRETVYGTTPTTPAMQVLRSTGDTLAYNKNQVTSREIRSDRNVPSIIEVGVTSEGAINLELSCSTYDDLFEALLCGTWATDVLKNGVTMRSYTIEKEFSDIASSFIQYLGMRVVEGTLNFRAQQIIDGSFTFWGKNSTKSGTTVKGSDVAATTFENLSASADVGTLQYKGADLTSGIKDLALTITNNPRHRPIVGSKFDADIGFGQLNVRVTGTALVDSLAMFQDVIDHASVALEIPVQDNAGNSMTFIIPALKLSGNPDTPAGNQDVDFRFTGEAQLDAATSCMIEIDRVVA